MKGGLLKVIVLLSAAVAAACGSPEPSTPTPTPVSIAEYAETFCTWGIHTDPEQGVLLDAEVRRATTPPPELRAYHDATIAWQERVLDEYQRTDNIFSGSHTEDLDRINAAREAFSPETAAEFEEACMEGGTHEGSIFHQIATPSP